MFKMVVVSHLGELTSAPCTVGDTLRFRIYYSDATRQRGAITLADQLAEGLTYVRSSGRGRYNRATRTVTWELPGTSPVRGAFVDVEARVERAGLIENDAHLVRPSMPAEAHRGGLRPVAVLTTNQVSVHAGGPPRLGWVPFSAEAEEGRPPAPSMKDETTTGETINVDIDGMYVSEVFVDGTAFHRLSIPGHVGLRKVGHPELPVVGACVEIPLGVHVQPLIVKSSSITLAGYNVYPAQEPLPRLRPDFRGVFQLDRATYLADAFQPPQLAAVEVEDIGVIRGHRVAFLKVHPLQYNPMTRELRAFSNIEVRLEYNRPAQIEGIPRRIESAPFEELLTRTLLNYRSPGRYGRSGDYEAEVNGCHYLILTHPNLYNPADASNPVVRLSNWKRRKGLITRVVDVTTIPGGNTAAAIRAFVQGAYDNWNPAPAYVLLVGDAELVPRNDGITHDYHVDSQKSATPIGTDLDYGTTHGADYFPDIFVGRLSVDSAAQCADVIDKILRYEQNPPANANYYRDTSLVGLFEDTDSNGREDDTFRIIEYSEAIRTFLQGQNYNVRRIYARSGTAATGPQQYENGTGIPVELTLAGNPPGIPGFAWNGGTADIRAAFNGGNFLITYDGHGRPDRWAQPRLSTADLAGLTNQDLNPVVLSFTCMTGWFDNEINAGNVDTNPDVAGVQGLGVNDESFCELLLRPARTGAVAVVGATRISWENNDEMMLGVYKAIWPEFAPAPPTSHTLPQMTMGPLVRLGQVLNFSKFYMANVYKHDFNRESTFEMYHLYGDPEMPIWTQAPVALAVDHPIGIGATGPQDFVVTVTEQGTGTPVASALVTLTRRVTTGGNPVDRVIDTQSTNPAGMARFNVHDIGGGEIDITATALGCRPFTGKIAVVAGGATINRLDPQDGTEGQLVHVGGIDFGGAENVDVYLGHQLMKTVGAAGGSFGQAGADVDITIPTPSPLGPVNVIAVGQTSGRYAVDVFQVRTKNPVDLYTYSQWDPTTWGLTPGGGDPVWDNPEIQLYEAGTPVGSNNLVVGHTYQMRVRVHNDTSFTAKNARVTLRWADFGIGGPWYDFDTVALDIPAGGADATGDFTPPTTGHVCVLAEIYHAEDIATGNNSGQENTHVGATSSPARACFAVWNPTDKPAAVHLEVRQLRSPTAGDDELWAARVVHPDPQVLQPGARAEACVVVEPDPERVRPGTTAEFAVTGFVSGQMIGGVNLLITKR